MFVTFFPIQCHTDAHRGILTHHGTVRLHLTTYDFELSGMQGNLNTEGTLDHRTILKGRIDQELPQGLFSLFGVKRLCGHDDGTGVGRSIIR